MPEIFEETWASDDDALIDVPSAAEIRHGFACGPASPGRFNWLFQVIMEALNDLDIGGDDLSLRLINTTEGVKGGGSLEADRTLRLAIELLEAEDEIEGSDLVVVYDISAAKHVQMTRDDFLAGVGGGGGGGITGGVNIGTGDGPVYSGISGANLQFRKIKAGDGIEVSVATNDVVIDVADRGSELTFS
jgi:hypothetical protein